MDHINDLSNLHMNGLMNFPRRLSLQYLKTNLLNDHHVTTFGQYRKNINVNQYNIVLFKIVVIVFVYTIEQ